MTDRLCEKQSALSPGCNSSTAPTPRVCLNGTEEINLLTLEIFRVEASDQYIHAPGALQTFSINVHKVKFDK